MVQKLICHQFCIIAYITFKPLLGANASSFDSGLDFLEIWLLLLNVKQMCTKDGELTTFEWTLRWNHVSSMVLEVVNVLTIVKYLFTLTNDTLKLKIMYTTGFTSRNGPSYKWFLPALHATRVFPRVLVKAIFAKNTVTTATYFTALGISNNVKADDALGKCL